MEQFTRCPKCGSDRVTRTECQVCGLVFEKYVHHQYVTARLQVEPTKPKNKGLVLIGLLVLVAVLGSGLTFLRSQKAAEGHTGLESQHLGSQKASDREGLPTGMNLIEQLQTANPPDNQVERVVNSTVFIQTPWGEGSGFIVDESCRIVTNSHVVRLSEDQVRDLDAYLADLRVKADKVRKIIDKNQDSYDRYQQGELRLSPGVTEEEIEAKMVEDKEKYAEFLKEIDASERRLDRNRYDSSLKVILSDGTEIDATTEHVDDEFDIAIVRVFGEYVCPSVVFGSSEKLRRGETLYTIGNPLGLRHVVTAGVFSGMVEVNGMDMLQSDAPINPGNSGGPLIDADGKVVGVNTLKLMNSDGIGFAIPIKHVKDLLAEQDL